jgi:hypothetical protein
MRLLDAIPRVALANADQSINDFDCGNAAAATAAAAAAAPVDYRIGSNEMTVKKWALRY